MKTLEIALVPGALAGLLNIFTSWLWMGVIFHRFQKQTPAMWRPENGRSYAIAVALHFVACLAIATLYIYLAQNSAGIFGAGMLGALRFGAILWLAIAAPFALESAIFIRLHPGVVLGQLLDWLTTSLLACALAAWWSHR
jgi:hypothetical protein